MPLNCLCVLPRKQDLLRFPQSWCQFTPGFFLKLVFCPLVVTKCVMLEAGYTGRKGSLCEYIP